MNWLIVLILALGIYCTVELVLKHREKMALIAKGQNPDEGEE